MDAAVWYFEKQPVIESELIMELVKVRLNRQQDKIWMEAQHVSKWLLIYFVDVVLQR